LTCGPARIQGLRFLFWTLIAEYTRENYTQVDANILDYLEHRAERQQDSIHAGLDSSRTLVMLPVIITLLLRGHDGCVSVPRRERNPVEDEL